MANNFLALSGSIVIDGAIQTTGGDFQGNLIGTSSHATYADNLNSDSLTLANLTITNTASIQYLDVVYQSASIVYSSGSNVFGDAPDDVQTLHGQVEILNNLEVEGNVVVNGGISGNITGSLLGDVVGNADTATSASHANLADYAQAALSGSHSLTSDYAQAALSASHASNSDFAQTAISSSHALNSDYAQSAISASSALEANHAVNADTASYVFGAVTLQNVLPGEVLFAGPNGEVTGSQTFTYDWANGVSIQSDADIIISASGETEIQGRDFRVDVTDDIRIFGNDSFFLANRSANDSISIYTDYANNEYRFEFEANGNLQMPYLSDGTRGQLIGTASHALYADSLTSDSLTLANLTITNTASIQYLDVVYQSSSIIYSSGSNVFGDAADDTQTFHGQVEIINDAHIAGTLQVDGLITGNISGNAATATSASHALAADSANNSSAAVSASYADVANLAYSANNATNAVNAQNATSATNATNAVNAQNAILAQSASFVIGAKDVGFQKEWHVSDGSGSDATGNGSLTKPFKTLGRAFAAVGGTGEQIVIHPGLYLEDTATLTMPNVSICAANFNAGGICYMNGTVTIAAGSSSTRISGILFNNLVHSGSAGLYLDKVQVKANYTKIGSGYSEILNSDLQATGSVVFRGGTTVISGEKNVRVTASGSGTAVYIKDSFSTVAPSAVAGGTLVVADSQVYPLASGSAAITSQAGTVVYLYNSQVTTTTGQPERLNIGGFLGYDDVQFNKSLSTLGTSLNIRANFQSLDVNNLTATGSLLGNASTATSASFATVANALNPGSSVSAINITGSGNLQVSGKVNFLNLPNFSDDVAAAAGGVSIGDLYRNGNFVVIRVA